MTGYSAKVYRALTIAVPQTADLSQTTELWEIF